MLKVISDIKYAYIKTHLSHDTDFLNMGRHTDFLHMGMGR